MLYLRTFGTLSLEAERTLSGAAVQRSRLALLAVLAAAGDSGVGRDKLLTIFWPEADTERARGALKQALYVLRRDLGGDVVIGNGELRLNGDVISTDVGEFQRAVARGDGEGAAALYNGAFLDGVFLRGSPEFERWAEHERARFAHAFMETLKQLAAAADARGDYAGAVVWWHKAAALDPLSSSTAVSFVRSLALGGETARALRQAEIHREVVKQEIGVYADPALEAIVTAILSGDLGSSAEAIPEAARASLTPASSVSFVEGPAIDAGSRASGAVSAAASARSKRWWLVPGLAIAGLAGVVGFSAWQHLNARPLENSVAVSAACSGTGGTDSATPASSGVADVIRDQFASGLTVLPGVVVRADGRSSRAHFLVFAKCRIDGDSATLSADLVDRDSDRVLTTIGPVRGRRDRLDDDIALLRDRVLSATAVRVDPKLKSWAYASNAPTVFDAYRELRAGIDAFTKGELADAATHFTKSAALDSLSPTPIVWAAFARAFYFDAAADSILQGLSASQRRLGPWDAAMLDFLKAFRQGDLILAHAMAHRVATTVPNSEWRVIVATSALNAARPKETLDVLRGLEPGAGWTEGWVFYWTTIGSAHHWLGQYEQELVEDRRAQRSLLYNGLILVQMEVKALAALGRVSELTRRLDEIEAERQRGYWAPFDPLRQAAAEVRAHLGVAAARPFYDRLISQERSHRDSLMALSAIALTEQDNRIFIADDLASAGRLDEARGLLDSVMALRKLPEFGALIVDAEIAALAGDADRAHRALAQVEQRRYAGAPAASGPTVGQVSNDSELADIYALLGEKDAAVGLYARAISNGMAFRDVIHLNLGTNRLRGYPPFEALVKPIDTPETR